jgi:hypothetical protein
MNSSEKFLIEAEKRFKKTSNIKEDIFNFPLKNNISNIQTNKEKSKEFSEVFTPLWLVDQMISQANIKDCDIKTLDLCAGYGQFSIRLLRFLYNNYSDFNTKNYIRNNHHFSELQLSSCYKLLLSFGVNINLFIGNSMYLNKLPSNAKGIWCYIENFGYWVCLTKTIKKILNPDCLKKTVKEDVFVYELTNLINNLNEVHSKMVDLDQIKNGGSKYRLDVLSKLNADTAETSMQSVDTPQCIINDMISCVEDLEKKSILVLFNCEIIEALVHKNKVDPDKITFATDYGSSLEAKAVEKIYGVKTIAFNKDLGFFAQTFKGKKFDLCLSNPPYNDGIDLKILFVLLDNNISKEYVIVHPSTWILDLKGKKEIYLSLKSKLINNLKYIKLFNGNDIFNIDLFLPCSITHIDYTTTYDTVKVNYFNKIFYTKSINDITKYSLDWEDVVKPFFNKIKSFTNKNVNVWYNATKKINNKSNCCQLACIIGNHSKDKNILVKNDFYTMTIKNSKANSGIRDTKLSMPTFEFNSNIERDNFLSYLNTDFARFCLSLYKINANLHRGELEIIPWLDFTQSWDDEKLFKYFDVDKKTQDYIRSFLPDYYGIRK